MTIWLLCPYLPCYSIGVLDLSQQSVSLNCRSSFRHHNPNHCTWRKTHPANHWKDLWNNRSHQNSHISSTGLYWVNVQSFTMESLATLPLVLHHLTSPWYHLTSPFPSLHLILGFFPLPECTTSEVKSATGMRLFTYQPHFGCENMVGSWNPYN